MSVSASDWVWKHSKTNGNDRLVLLYLADQGDEDGGNCFPGLRLIAERCHIGLGTVRDVLRRLEAAGEIIVDRPERQGRGQFNRYRLVLGRGPDSNTFPDTPDRAGTRGPGPRDTGPERGGERAGTRGPGPRGPLDPETLTRESPQEDVSPPAPTTTPRASRIPDPFYVTEEMREWAGQEVPGFDWKAETRKFVDYWRAAAGANARKMDWPATWRNWMRRADDEARPGRGRATGSSRDRQADARLRLVDKLTGTEAGA